jgi:hypothetical protein
VRRSSVSLDHAQQKAEGWSIAVLVTESRPATIRPWVLLVLVFALITGAVGILASKHGQADVSGRDNRGIPKAFLGCLRSPGNSIGARRTSAVRLAEHQSENAPWIVILLTCPESFDNPFNPVHLSHDPLYRQFDVAVICALVQSLPKNCDRSILWAMTYLLSDTTVGCYSDSGTLGLEHKEIHLPPLNEVIQLKLVETLGKDHGQDGESWRELILGQP